MTKTTLALSSFFFAFGVAVSANAAVLQVSFDDYASPTDNQLGRDFLQTDAGGVSASLYTQSATGGVSGGSVIGYAGDNYFATAVYQPAFLDFSTPAANAALSLDFFYDGQLHPLCEGCNGVRSFRLGMVGSASGAFETYGVPSIYVEGVYSLDLDQMLLVARSLTASVSTSIVLAEVPLAPNSWYRVDLDLTNTGGDNIHWESQLWGLGAAGNTTPSLLATGAWNYQNAAITTDAALYGGFSALTDGGVPRVDNLTLSNFTVVPVPIPAVFWLFASGLAALVGASRGRDSVRKR